MKLLVIAPLLLLAGGCSIDKMAANNMVPVLRRTEDRFERSRTPKAARQAGPGLLFTLDGLIETSPENPELLVLGAQMNAAFAFGFIEDEDEEYAKELYDKARDYARRAFAVEDEHLLKQFEDPGKLQGLRDALKVGPKLDEDTLPAAFWLGFALGSRINLDRADEKLLGQLGLVDNLMSHVLATDEKFFNAGPHLYFAVRYAALAPTMGGNPDKALEHFKAVDRITQNRHLMSKVLRAKFYSCSMMAKNQKGAWEDFFTTLEEVVKAKDDLWPEQRLANEVAKVKAKKLLARPSDAQIDPPAGVANPYAE
ncbi:MAG: TRAP transporter TatT component family protein [Planctomycetota bacterium]